MSTSPAPDLAPAVPLARYLARYSGGGGVYQTAVVALTGTGTATTTVTRRDTGAVIGTVTRVAANKWFAVGADGVGVGSGHGYSQRQQAVAGLIDRAVLLDVDEADPVAEAEADHAAAAERLAAVMREGEQALRRRNVRAALSRANAAAVTLAGPADEQLLAARALEVLRETRNLVAPDVHTSSALTPTAFRLSTEDRARIDRLGAYYFRDGAGVAGDGEFAAAATVRFVIRHLCDVVDAATAQDGGAR